jgi:hypothetical protein
MGAANVRRRGVGSPELAPLASIAAYNTSMPSSLARQIYLAAVPDPRYEIFLFGSRARGHSSDVDIGIAGPEPLPGGVSRLMNELLESDVPWRCQVIDFGLVTAEKFRRHAYEGREVWRAATILDRLPR